MKDNMVRLTTNRVVKKTSNYRRLLQQLRTGGAGEGRRCNEEVLVLLSYAWVPPWAQMRRREQLTEADPDRDGPVLEDVCGGWRRAQRDWVTGSVVVSSGHLLGLSTSVSSVNGTSKGQASFGVRRGR